MQHHYIYIAASNIQIETFRYWLTQVQLEKCLITKRHMVCC